MARPSYFGDAYLIEESATDTKLWGSDEPMGTFLSYDQALQHLKRHLDETQHWLPIYHRTPEHYLFLVDVGGAIQDAWL